MNKRVTAKEHGLLKGALRRVFSRSDLRKAAVEQSRVSHTDVNRKRVTKWSRCPRCKEFTPTYLMEVDHLIPIVKVTETVYDLDMNTLVDRIWCDPENLQAICKTCHKAKTKEENRERRKYQKERKNARR